MIHTKSKKIDRTKMKRKKVPSCNEKRREEDQIVVPKQTSAPKLEVTVSMDRVLSEESA